MSQERQDVRVCFRPLLEVREVVLLTHSVLQEFPSRILPEFRPWFPSASDTRRPIRPQNPPPLISSFSEEPRDIPDASDAGAERKPVPEPKRFQRSWCVITDRTAPLRITHSFSRPFRKAIEKHGLNLHQRVKWVVCERSCVSGGVEELWLELNRAIRHSRLPTCNANFQRALAQIWLYCDVFYCEYIGNFLKQELQLSGQITLTAHKLGDIINL